MSEGRWPRFPDQAGFARNGGSDTLWIKISPLLINSRNYNGRYDGGYNTSATSEVFYFMAPNDITENLNHNWEDNSDIGANIGTKITDNLGKADKLAETIYNIATAAQAGSGRSMGTQVAASSTQSAFFKYDSPLIYNGANKREVTFTFELADQGDPGFDVYEPINTFLKYSCPGVDGQDFIKMKQPYLFEVVTVDGNNVNTGLIHLAKAALTSVQPAYHYPFRNGHPTKAELTLTFRNTYPSYRDTWDEGGGSPVTVAVLPPTK
jgi:hypothetical protein